MTRTIFSGLVRGDFLDVDAALGAGHEHDLAVGAVEDDAEVELAGDVDAGHDQDLVDGVAANVHAEDGSLPRAPRRAICASLMPPALPRPPVCTWALTATSPPNPAAAVRLPPASWATLPAFTGMPYRARISAA